MQLSKIYVVLTQDDISPILIRGFSDYDDAIACKNIYNALDADCEYWVDELEVIHGTTK